MNGNAELLNFIYQNSQMGVNTIEKLLEVCDESEFKQHLQSQHDEYQAINREADVLLAKNGYQEKGISAFDKLKTYIMINIQTLADKSNSHIAEMMMVGSTMGIIQSLRNIRKYKNADSHILELMERLLKFEENNISDLKQFV